MTSTPNFMLFGQEEVWKLNSSSHGMQIQAQTMPQIMYQLQMNAKQNWHKINEPHQSQNEVKHVKNQSTKFQLHVIRHENFTSHVKAYITRRSTIGQTGEKLSNK